MAQVIMRDITLGILAACLPAAMLAAGCKSASPDAPSTPAPAATFTITAEGVSPKSVSIALGDRVVFVNSDVKTHSIGSDPHPDHTDCPNINQVGFLRPGDRRETGNFVTARVCGFHDHDAPNDQTLYGSITIR
jgi:plastocyanin